MIGRRTFLSTSLQAGGLMVVCDPALAALATATPATVLMKPLILLRAPGDAPFAEAVRNVWSDHPATPATELTLTDELIFDTAGLRRELAARRGIRLVGFMDTCAETLLEEAIRDVGGTVLCKGWHAGHPDDPMASRHHFLTSEASQGIGAAMAGIMNWQGDSFLIQESPRHVPLPPAGRRAPVLRQAAWPVLLGRSLAMIAAGAWLPGPVVPHAASEALSHEAISGAHASIVAEI